MKRQWLSFLHGKEDGQALLIVVLVMVVTLTVGLSLASRSITNLRNTTDEANSEKAFAAAEAGIEQAIKTGSPITTPIDLGNNSQISTVSAQIIAGGGGNGDEYLLNNGNPIFQDDGADVWLSPHDQTPLFSTPWGMGAPETLSLYWGTHSDPCSEPAVEVLVVSSTSTTAPQMHAVLSRYAFDTCAARRSNNHFSSAYNTVSASLTAIDGSSQSFNYRVDIPITNGLLFRVIPLYTSGIFGVKGLGLPSQGQLLTSTGTAGSIGQATVRKVTFFKGYQGLPSELLYALFSTK